MSDLDLTRLSDSLVCGESGIWSTTSAVAAKLSFPEAGYYANFKLEDESFWFTHRNEILAIALSRFPIRGAFLDIGAGNGVVSVRLAKSGIETVALEPGRDGAVHAKQRGLSNVVWASLDDAKFKAGSFAGAGLFDVIEHVADPVPLLRATSRVLAPGGVLAVTAPTYEWLWSDADDSAGHFRRYTRTRLHDELENAGFEVKYSSYFFAALTLPIFLGRSLHHRFGRRRDVYAAAEEEHKPRALVSALLAPELEIIRRGRSIPFGTSCLAIAVPHSFASASK